VQRLVGHNLRKYPKSENTLNRNHIYRTFFHFHSSSPFLQTG